jgi:hypothetical protein
MERAEEEVGLTSVLQLPVAIVESPHAVDQRALGVGAPGPGVGKPA